MNPMIRILYSCHLCGLDDQAIEVPGRGDEDVKEWFENTLVATIDKDHRRRSPNCSATRIDTIKIPIHGAEKIGGPAIA